MAQVLTIPLGFGNAYLVIDRQAIIVDSGYPRHEKQILQKLREAGLQPGDVSMLFLTHGHVDHFGSMYALKQYIDAPIAIARPDLEFFLTGRQGTLVPITRLAKIMTIGGQKLRVKKRYGIEAEIVFTDDVDLDPFGVAGKLIPTPGHTLGSASLLLDDGQAVTGDTIMCMPPFNEGRCFPPPFMQDYGLYKQSIARLYAEGAHTFYPGHGHRITKQQLWLGPYGKEKAAGADEQR